MAAVGQPFFVITTSRQWCCVATAGRGPGTTARRASRRRGRWWSVDDGSPKVHGPGTVTAASRLQPSWSTPGRSLRAPRTDGRRLAGHGSSVSRLALSCGALMAASSSGPSGPSWGARRWPGAGRPTAAVKPASGAGTAAEAARRALGRDAAVGASAGRGGRRRGAVDGGASTVTTTGAAADAGADERGCRGHDEHRRRGGTAMRPPPITRPRRALAASQAEWRTGSSSTRVGHGGHGDRAEHGGDPLPRPTADRTAAATRTRAGQCQR